MYYNNIGEKIIYVNQSSTDPLFFVYNAGITYPNPKYSIIHNTNRFNKWDNYEFEYIVSGKGYIESGSQHSIVRAGDFVFQNRGIRLSYRADKREPFEKIFLTVRGRLIDKLCEAYSLTDNILICHIDLKKEFEQILKLLEREKYISSSYHAVTLQLHSIIQQVCALRSTSNIVDQPLSRTQTIAQQLRIYIDNNIGTIRSLEQIADYADLSQSQVIRIFNREFGTTPMKYLLDKRIDHAEYMIRMTDTPIFQIAEQLGFVDACHLSTTFKKAFKISPKQYRMQLRKPQ